MLQHPHTFGQYHIRLPEHQNDHIWKATTPNVTTQKREPETIVISDSDSEGEPLEPLPINVDPSSVAAITPATTTTAKDTAFFYEVLQLLQDDKGPPPPAEATSASTTSPSTNTRTSKPAVSTRTNSKTSTSTSTRTPRRCRLARPPLPSRLAISNFSRPKRPLRIPFEVWVPLLSLSADPPACVNQVFQKTDRTCRVVSCPEEAFRHGWCRPHLSKVVRSRHNRKRQLKQKAACNYIV